MPSAPVCRYELQKELDTDEAEEEGRIEENLVKWRDEKEAKLRAQFDSLDLHQQQQGAKQHPVFVDSAELDDVGATAMTATASPLVLPFMTAAEDVNSFSTPLQHLPMAAKDSMKTRIMAAIMASTQASSALEAHMTALDSLMERFQLGMAATVKKMQKNWQEELQASLRDEATLQACRDADEEEQDALNKANCAKWRDEEAELQAQEEKVRLQARHDESPLNTYELVWQAQARQQARGKEQPELGLLFEMKTLGSTDIVPVTYQGRSMRFKREKLRANKHSIWFESMRFEREKLRGNEPLYTKRSLSRACCSS